MRFVPLVRPAAGHHRAQPNGFRLSQVQRWPWITQFQAAILKRDKRHNMSAASALHLIMLVPPSYAYTTLSCFYHYLWCHGHRIWDFRGINLL